MSNQYVIPSDGFVRLSQILSVIPISRSAWWAGVKSGKFPSSVKLGERTTCWLAKDIHELIEKFSTRGTI